MLSEFEVPKPENGFNQIILEPEEVFIDGLRVTMLLTGDWQVPGHLRVCSRCLVFQPRSEDAPLLKFKFADSIQMTSGKLSLSYVEKELGESYEEFISNLKRVMRKPSTPTGQAGPAKTAPTTKQTCLLLKVKRFVVYPTQPVSPYATEIFRCYFLFRIDGPFKYQTGAPPSTLPDDMAATGAQFERLFNRIKKCENEDDLIEQLIQERYMAYRAKVSATSRVSFMYPCKIVETFEKFYGCICLKDDRKVKVKPLLNVTKKAGKSFECREVKWMTLFQFFYRKTGIEFFFFNSPQSLLLDFGLEKTAEKVFGHLAERCTELMDLQLNALTKTWNSNLMSNYDYLMYLNRLSNRSFNDISRYPLFPWVVADFASDDFQINQKSQYRDLSKPLHGHWKSREAKAADLFEHLAKDPVPTRKPYHCPQFSSTPGGIVYFYTRTVPLLITRLQSDAFGLSDRIFRGFEVLWSQMQTGQTQFVELIPEMYTVNKADLLRNKFGLDFGSTADGEEVSDVGLPRWANSTQDFLFKMRAALESEFCSLHLHQWIDLVFGAAAAGDGAVRAANVFAEECYKESFEGTVVRSKLKEQANKMLIHQFGQLPVQLFTAPHPKKRIKAQFVTGDGSGKGRGDAGYNGYLVKLTTDVDGERRMEDEDSALLHVQNLANSSELFDKLNQRPHDLEDSGRIGSPGGDDASSGIDWPKGLESGEED